MNSSVCRFLVILRLFVIMLLYLLTADIIENRTSVSYRHFIQLLFCSQVMEWVCSLLSISTRSLTVKQIAKVKFKLGVRKSTIN